MKRTAAAALSVCALFLFLLLLVSCAGTGKKPDDRVSGRESSPVSSPAPSSFSGNTQSASSGEPDDKAPVLYEYLESYSDHYLMPTKPDRLLGGIVTASFTEGESIVLTVSGKDFEFRKQETEILKDSEGKELYTHTLYYTGGRFYIGSRSSATMDENGKLISANFIGDFLPENFGEEDVRAKAAEIAKSLCDYDLGKMDCVFRTVWYGDGGEHDDAHFLKPDEPGAANYRYTVSYRQTVGGLKGGRYIDITFDPIGIPVPMISVKIGREDCSEYLNAPSFDTAELMIGMLRDVDEILEDDSQVEDVFFRDRTMRFTLVGGKPCVIVDAVVTLKDDTQYETTLCYMYEESALR